MLLVYDDGTPVDFEAGQHHSRSWDQTPSLAQAHRRLAENAVKLGGGLVTAEALEAPEMATTLRTDVVTDGPAVDTVDNVVALYVVDAPDLDRALDLARWCPLSGAGSVEVRPVRSTRT